MIHLDGPPLEIIQAQLAAPRPYCSHLFHGRRCSPGHRQSTRCLHRGLQEVVEDRPHAAGFSLGRAHGIVWHNTRHSAVTNLVNAGVPKHEAKATSGHHSDQVFDRSIGTEH